MKLNEIVLTKSQKKAYDLMVSGKNTFITGEGGTGKSTLLNIFIEKCAENNKQVVCLAPTGIAAININGTTLHRFFRLRPDVFDPNRLNYKEKANPALKAAEIIIIDEISMVRVDLFDAVMKRIFNENDNRKRKKRRFAKLENDYTVKLEKWKQETMKFDEGKSKRKTRPSKPKESSEFIELKNTPLNPIQLILCGDFSQLAPVIAERDKELLSLYYPNLSSYYAFKSLSWDKCNLEYIRLEEVVRQNDQYFVELLEQIRVSKKEALSDIYTYSNKNEFKNAIYLTGRNNDALKINTSRLEELVGKSKHYYIDIKGVVNKGDLNCDEELILKEGAKVMLITNDSIGRYCNGDFAIVEDIFEDNKIYVRLLKNNEQCCIKKKTWEVVNYVVEEEKHVLDDGTIRLDKKVKKEVIGSYTQFPLKLAYAITIHKSQGLTFEQLNIFPNCWDYGQLYVAISRAKSLEGMHFMSYPYASCLKTHQDVIDFYNMHQLNQVVQVNTFDQKDCLIFDSDFELDYLPF